MPDRHTRLIRLIAPSGYCLQQEAAHRGINRLQQAGHQVDNLDVVTRREQRFAGSDAQRLADINQLATLADLPDIVLAVRGGYGASRLLDKIDYIGLQRRLLNQPVALCGHSDFTAIQLALLAQTGLITFSGPMLAANFGAAQHSDFTQQHFWQALTAPQFVLAWPTSAPDCSPRSGRVWGGNLTMICSLIGTPWLPVHQDGILVIEDINEHPYKIERMMLQLQQSGILARQQAIVTGSFSSAAIGEYDNGFDFTTVWQRLRESTGLPIVTDLRFGHEADTVTVPLGARGELQVEAGTARLSLSGHPILT